MAITVQVKAQTSANEIEWFDIEVKNDMPSQQAFAIEEAKRQARKAGKGFILCDWRVVRN